MNLLTLHGRTYARRRAEREPVFVADQPRQSSAYDQAHLGPALLIEYLEPLMPQHERLAYVRLADGRVLDVAAAHLCPATGLAAHRILPRFQRVRLAAR